MASSSLGRAVHGDETCRVRDGERLYGLNDGWCFAEALSCAGANVQQR